MPGLSLPFASQPVQGFSSLVPDPKRRDWWLALADNGYGTKANSDDFLLRIYRVHPLWDAHRVEVDPKFIQLADPDHRAGFAIVLEHSAERFLTGADFDPESLVVTPDGSLWIGEEFGPFVLHFSAEGRLLESPYEKSGFRSPDNPFAPVRLRADITVVVSGFSRTSAEPSVRRSRGFEGLALRRDRRHLFAMLEAGLVGDAPNTTRILEFDIRERRFTDREWQYRFEGPEHSATEIVPTLASSSCPAPCESFFVIERDNEQGPAAKFKKIFRVDVGAPGVVSKTLAVDLLAIDNPQRIAGFPPLFTFPFITPEAVWQLDAHTVIVVNDNNYPETGGRSPDVRDDTEFIKVAF